MNRGSTEGGSRMIDYGLGVNRRRIKDKMMLNRGRTEGESKLEMSRGWIENGPDNESGMEWDGSKEGSWVLD